jgi:hypothetical protein
MKRLIGILALLTLGGIGTGCAVSTGSEYEVRISTSLSPAQAEEVFAATGEWEKATGVRFRIVFSNQGCESHCINIVPVASLSGIRVGEATRAFDDDRAVIRLLERLDNSPETLHQTLLHELGHAMGLPHNEKTGTIMFGSKDGAATYITCQDVASYFQVRGQEHSCQ